MWSSFGVVFSTLFVTIVIMAMMLVLMILTNVDADVLMTMMIMPCFAELF